MTNEEAKKAEKELNALLNMCNPSPLSKELEDALKMAIKALEAQPCIEDYPTCTECEHYDSEKHYCPRFCQVIKDTLAEAQPTEGDLISRKDVITALIDADWIKTTAQQAVIAEVLNKIPSVKPKKGKWIMNSDYPDRLICDKCNAQFDMWHWESKQMHYCPRCGADMSGGGEDGEDSACDRD